MYVAHSDTSHKRATCKQKAFVLLRLQACGILFLLSFLAGNRSNGTLVQRYAMGTSVLSQHRIGRSRVRDCIATGFCLKPTTALYQCNVYGQMFATWELTRKVIGQDAFPVDVTKLPVHMPPACLKHVCFSHMCALSVSANTFYTTSV